MPHHKLLFHNAGEKMFQKQLVTCRGDVSLQKESIQYFNRHAQAHLWIQDYPSPKSGTEKNLPLPGYMQSHFL